MEKAKRQRLEAKGWKLGSVSRFLGLTEAEAALVEIKARFSKAPATASRRRASLKSKPR